MSADVDKAKVIDEILRLQEARTAAILARDGAAMEKLFDDDLVHIHSSGKVDTKASYIEPLVSGTKGYKAIAYSNVKVRVYGDCAIASGDVIIESLRPSRLDLRYTNVWVNKGGAWRSVHWASCKRPA